jgi:hypothetical protein
MHSISGQISRTPIKQSNRYHKKTCIRAKGKVMVTKAPHSTWQQMVATYITGTGKRIYRNGTQVASDAQTGTVGTNAGGMSIAAYGGTGSNSYFYNGGLAICRIYNRALSLAEIQQNYNDQKARFGL